MQVRQEIIRQTKKWIDKVVIECNFCPFAKGVLSMHNAVFFQIDEGSNIKNTLATFLIELNRLDSDDSIETTFLILPNGYNSFEYYLDLVSAVEKYLEENGYDGIYQVASFHPNYLFDGSSEYDAANYTNRSVYPMLHILREASIDKALEHYKEPETIPNRNINFAKEKGLLYMKMLRDACTN